MISQHLVIVAANPSSELNPVELVFHVLLTKLRDLWNHGNMQRLPLAHKTEEVFDNIDYDIVPKCVIHYGVVMFVW